MFKVRIALILAGALIVLAITSESDLQQVQEDHRIYCQMVETGAWPDYNGNAAEVCADGQPAQEARDGR